MDSILLCGGVVRSKFKVALVSALLMTCTREEPVPYVCPHTLHVLEVFSCCFRLFSLVTNPAALFLAQKQDPHLQASRCHYVLVLTWPNKHNRGMKVFPRRPRTCETWLGSWLRSCINTGCVLIDRLWLRVQRVQKPPTAGEKTPA